jgi:diaminohydroxyphosphoribosylaminopyrimidine deaminase/5-amino-6-(5-phosphoribosylamino)uracil reductase
MPSEMHIDDELDRRLMAAAIRLSLWHRGLTGENPSVGALVVRRDGEGATIIGRGVTALGGRPHAELQALLEAGEGARGATVYSTLEPCSHIGRAPPCADALAAAGVSRVVIAALDPDRRVAGRGVAILQRGGVEVTTGCLTAEAARAMEGFLSLKGRGRPHLTLKLAVSADGMIGRAGGGQVTITNDISRRIVQMMRVEHEAIMVGVGTVVADDPLLTVRLAGLEARSPARIVIDPFARTSAKSRLFNDIEKHPVVMLVSEKAAHRELGNLRAAGATVRPIISDFRGRFDPREILRTLGVLGIKSVLLEGGADAARRFLDAGLVDRIALFTGQTSVGEGGIASPVTASTPLPDFTVTDRKQFGGDALIEYERKA